jgi:hypothetical protein
MKRPRYSFESLKYDKSRKEWVFTYLNDRGGAVLLTYNGLGTPEWQCLPDDFPVEDAKRRMAPLVLR